MIADERTCYVALDAQDSGYILHGFGEYQSLIDDDPCPAFIAGHNDSERLADDDTNIALHSSADIGDTSWRSGYVRRGVVTVDHSSFAILNMGINRGAPVCHYQGQFKTTVPDGVSWLHLPLVIKAINDVAAGTNLPCGVLRGLRGTLCRPSTGEFSAGDRTLFGVQIDAGGNVFGFIIIDITGSWD